MFHRSLSSIITPFVRAGKPRTLHDWVGANGDNGYSTSFGIADDGSVGYTTGDVNNSSYHPIHGITADWNADPEGILPTAAITLTVHGLPAHSIVALHAYAHLDYPVNA